MFYLVFILFSSFLFSAPPKTIPPELFNAFTWNSEIPVEIWYFDNTYSKPLDFNTQVLEGHIAKARKREIAGYGQTDTLLFELLDKLKEEIIGKEVAVIGSTIPWYESVLITYGAHPVVIEYNPITTDDCRVTYLTVEEYKKKPKKFDFILSISSTEHDGLGRYGDPLDPDGDLKSMLHFKEMLKEGGQLILAVPLGQDKLVWNAHRIYGEKRLKLLLNGWEIQENLGFEKEKLTQDCGYEYQPIFLLKPKDDVEKCSLLIKIPTRGRFEAFFKALDAYYANLSWEVPFHFIISCDEDDPVMNSPAVKEKLQSYRNLDVYYGKSKSKIEACNQDMDKCGDFEVLLLGSDDMIPLVKGYDKVILSKMKTFFPDMDGVLHFNEGAGPAVDPLPIMGHKFYERFGYIYYPEYQSFYCDNEMTEVSRALNKYVYIDQLLIEHRSPGNNKRASDALYERNYAPALCQADERLYRSRKDRNFDLKMTSIESPQP